ncbi:MAG: ThuA domain-containing protein [Treponema sp.]|nr:ThuA domain-containing protein [Treponema sp.]MCL2271517.1 ThuA domain-containing protein [Treponema sp.]
MRVLLICDDYWHPGQIAIDGIEPLKKRGFQFDVISNAKEFSSSALTQYPAILLCKSDEISQTDKEPWRTKEIQDAFAGFVENGGGLVAVHSAIVASKEKAAFDQLIGCRFIGHPNACPVTVSPVKNHPVTEGACMFRETDEHYRIEITAEDADVLLASYSPPQGEESKYEEDPYHNTEASIYAAGFVRTQGKGRVCVLTPGHNLSVWLNPLFQKLLENALNWTAGK